MFTTHDSLGMVYVYQYTSIPTMVKTGGWFMTLLYLHDVLLYLLDRRDPITSLETCSFDIPFKEYPLVM